MDGRTQSILTGNHFPLVAGSLPAEPYPFIRQLQEENRALREMREEAERYAKSLEAERYAKSLEAERERRTDTARRPWSLKRLLRRA